MTRAEALHIALSLIDIAMQRIAFDADLCDHHDVREPETVRASAERARLREAHVELALLLEEEESGQPAFTTAAAGEWTQFDPPPGTERKDDFD